MTRDHLRCFRHSLSFSLPDHVHPYYQKLFETGVDEMSWDDMDVMQVCGLAQEAASRQCSPRVVSHNAV